jgi:hypothetical protein
MTTDIRKFQEVVLDRLNRLEQAVFVTRSLKHAEAEGRKTRGAALPDHILKLRDSGFFDSPKTTGEVHERLQSKYPCEPDRVAMALLRLQRRRELRKSSKANGGKKQVAYVR